MNFSLAAPVNLASLQSTLETSVSNAPRWITTVGALVAMAAFILSLREYRQQGAQIRGESTARRTDSGALRFGKAYFGSSR